MPDGSAGVCAAANAGSTIITLARSSRPSIAFSSRFLCHATARSRCHDSPVTIDLFLVGFVHVARRFVQLLDESREALASHRVDARVVGIVTRRHGARWDDAGLDTSEAVRIVTAGSALGPPAESPLESIERWRSSRTETRVLVETTPLDVRSGEPAIG